MGDYTLTELKAALKASILCTALSYGHCGHYKEIARTFSSPKVARQ
jgi:hypothetical protein